MNPGNSCAAFNDEEIAELRAIAKSYREAGGPVVKLSNMLGDKIEGALSKVPEGWQAAVAQATDRVVLVKALMRLGGGLDVPGDQRGAERGGDLFGQHGLAGARLAFHQQRTAQQHGRIDRDLEVVRGDVTAGTFETLHHPSLS